MIVESGDSVETHVEEVLKEQWQWMVYKLQNRSKEEVTEDWIVGEATVVMGEVRNQARRKSCGTTGC